MRQVVRSAVMLVLPILGLLLEAAPAAGYPHRGQHLDFTQPDGSKVDLVLWGDEFYVRAESPDGYTLIVDPITNYVSYALSTPDGRLVPSGVFYRGPRSEAELLALGITRGARLAPALREQLASAKRSRLSPDVGKITPDTTTPQASSSASSTPRTWTMNGIQPIADPVPTGTITGLVVLVDFPDRKGSIASTEVDNAFNSTSTYGPTWHGSIRRWSEQISSSITSVQHRVAGYYTAKYNVAHYNAPTAEWDYSTSDELYREVYAYIESSVDIAPYAVKGRLPSLALIYAGDVIARNWAMALWPHGGCGDGSYRTSKGITIDKCFLTNLGTKTPIELSTFRHELGHSVFYWPDTYDYDNDSQSAGGFATEEDLPCAPFRMWAGWVKPTDVSNATGLFTVAADGSAFIRYNNPKKSKEYFVAEYAKKISWRSPPDEGLLIWHIDEDGDNSWQDMTASRHYALSVEQADGAFHLEKNVPAGSGDLFHAGDKTRFDNTTTPNSNWWDGSGSGLKLCDIGGLAGSTMTVNVGCVAVGGAGGTGGTAGAGAGGIGGTGGTVAKAGNGGTGGARGGTAGIGGSSNGSAGRGGATAGTGGSLAGRAGTAGLTAQGGVAGGEKGGAAGSGTPILTAGAAGTLGAGGLTAQAGATGGDKAGAAGMGTAIPNGGTGGVGTPGLAVAGQRPGGSAGLPAVGQGASPGGVAQGGSGTGGARSSPTGRGGSGTSKATNTEADGCGCSVTPRSSTVASVLTLALGLLLTSRRRRRATVPG